MMLKKVCMMITAFLLVFSCFQSLSFADSDEQKEKGVHLRVMSYNIHYGNNFYNQYDIESITNVIKDSGADIIGLQEVDVHWGDRSNFDNEIEKIAQSLNMHYFFAPIYNLSPLQAGQPNRQFGVAILSKYPILKAENREITRLSTQVPNPKPELSPGFAETLINVKGIKLNVYATHLDYRTDPTVRSMQVHDMLNIMSESHREKILFGDMNAVPTAPELQPLLKSYQDSWNEERDGTSYTFPAKQPDRKIDYILTTSGVNVQSSRTLDTLASDHRPIISDIFIKKD